MPKNDQYEIPSLIVNQWLPEWNDVKFIEDKLRRKPEPYFYIFSMRASWLRRLSDVYRRQAVGNRAEDFAIQRKLLPGRSKEIKQFIHGGFPWSNLSENQKKAHEFKNLKMPGWLSTSIIANILAPNTERFETVINNSDLIKIEKKENSVNLKLPDNFESENWNPAVKPIEIIDGQHRLLAFDEDDEIGSEFEFPVVAFYNLDVTWQAYLFYMINIKPKRLNASLAYDLYPILRTQDWLEASPTDAFIYKETRAQQLTELLWSYQESPWYKRINMLGESTGGTVTQASFIRSLTATYLKNWDSGKIGGLFGADENNPTNTLQWGRIQQSAFLIYLWQCIAEATSECDLEWAVTLRNSINQATLQGLESKYADFAFTSKSSLLAGDQGIRAILHLTNDLCFVAVKELSLSKWNWIEDLDSEDIEDEDIGKAITSLKKQPVSEFLKAGAKELMNFEWRNSTGQGLTREQSEKQMIFRGAGGYKQLRIKLIEKLMSSQNPHIKDTAAKVWGILDFEL